MVDYRMRILLRALGTVSLASSVLLAQQEPPRRLDLGGAVQEVESTDTLREARATTRDMRNAYVRNQLLLGALALGPGFAVMISDEPATRVAGWMVMAGASFFAANEVARQLEITPARQVLSSRMGWRGAANGLTLGDAWKLEESERGALVLIGGLTGSTLGVVMGTHLSEGEAVAAVVGHDLVAATAFGLSYVIEPNDDSNGGIRPSVRVAVPLALGWGGYWLGQQWARNSDYEVTAGDAVLLWLGAGIGAAGATTFIIESEPNDQVLAGALVIGGLVGVWGADRFLVRKFDHSRGEGGLVASGAAAGSLMGVGVSVLVSGEAVRNSAPTFAFGTLGALAGAWVTERYARPARDEGRRYDLGSRLQLNPLGAVAALSGTPGMHSIARFTF